MTMLIAQSLFKSYLEPGEKIEAIFHRHPFVMIPDFLRIGFFGFVLPGFLYVLFPQFVLFLILWLVIGMIRVIYVVMGWYYDALMITDVSLLDVLWNGFFDRSSSRLEYNMIEGITYNFKGVIQTIFNYGLVTIQRAGGGTEIYLKEAMNPKKIERKVMAYQEGFVTHQSLKDADSLKGLLTTLVRHHAKTGTFPSEAAYEATHHNAGAQQYAPGQQGHGNQHSKGVQRGGVAQRGQSGQPSGRPNIQQRAVPKPKR